MSGWDNWVLVFVPSLSLGVLFWLIMRFMLNADRSERETYQKILEEERKLAQAKRAGHTDTKE